MRVLGRDQRGLHVTHSACSELVTYEVKKNEEVIISDDAGNTLKIFKVREDLDKALFLLKQINSLKTINNNPIYLVKIFNAMLFIQVD